MSPVQREHGVTEAELKQSDVRVEGVQLRKWSLVNQQYPSEDEMLPGYCGYGELESEVSQMQQVCAEGRDVKVMCLW